MFEGGSRVPLIVNWKGTVAGGRTSGDLVDFTDMLPTFAALAGAPLPSSPALDGRSFAPQIRGERGSPRPWVYVQHNTAHEWYALEHGSKLTQAGDLFDMADAPFAEKLVSPGEPNEVALAARERLQAALNGLNPAAGKLAPERKPGDLEKAKKKKKQKRKAAAAKERPVADAVAPPK